MSEDKVRAEFEAWVGIPTMLNRRESPALWGGTAEEIARHDANPYDHPWTRGAWEAWQASRAALVVDVPDENDDRFWSLLDEPTADGNSHIFLEGTFADSVRAAIEAAGVRVKD